MTETVLGDSLFVGGDFFAPTVLAACYFTRDVGREGGHHGLEEYLDVKYVSLGGISG